jgi:hypothetical protein
MTPVDILGRNERVPADLAKNQPGPAKMVAVQIFKKQSTLS